MDIPSEEVTLVDRESDILSKISPYFQVSETKYGGKGCFSYEHIPKGTEILVSNPLGFTISKDFKKEVCLNCFKYNNGRTMKAKYSLPNFKSQYIYFCSEECVKEFKAHDESEVFLSALLNLDKYYSKYNTDDDPEPINVNDKEFVFTIKEKWSEVNQWVERINQTKKTKWDQFIPKINESEYLEAKYVLSVLHQYYITDKHDPHEPDERFIQDYELNDAMIIETTLFSYLQSSEILKVLKFKNLLQSYINIFKFLKLTCPPNYQKFIDPLTVRLIIGNNLTNAFGIWTLEAGDKEFLGFGVYPSASFFNHSCEPNIIKKRINNQLHFVTLRDIKKNEELCIDYGNYLNETFEVRRKQLNEWFFLCGCTRCQRESKALS